MGTIDLAANTWMIWYWWVTIGLGWGIILTLAWSILAICKQSDEYLEQQRKDRIRRDGIGRR